MNETLQLVNIALTGGVLVALIGAAVKYGRLVEKVDTHDREIFKLRDSHHDIRNVIMEHIGKTERQSE